MSVSFNLNRKIAVGTRGAGGIGGAVASKLALAGARTWTWDLAEPDGVQGHR